MKKTFIEATDFTEWCKNYLDDDQLSALQRDLMANPANGVVIPGCGGLRKVRVGDPSRGKGKRGGCRVIYLYVQEVDVIYLLDIYGKNEKDDLSTEQKKVLRQLADQCKRAAIAAARAMRKKSS